MFIHNDPAATVIELVSDNSTLRRTVVSQLPNGTTLPSRVKYAVAQGISEDLDKMPLHGTAFSLGRADEPLPIDTASADLLVVSRSVGAHEELDAILSRFTSFGKSNAVVIFEFEARTAPVLEAKGFRLSFCIQGAAIYKQQSERTNDTDYVNGDVTNNSEFVVIEPSAPSTTVKSFSSALQKELAKEFQKIIVTTWSDFSIQHADETEGRTLISLVELESPLLDRLSESDFDKLKRLTTHCERLLWVTGGHDPSMAMVDGLSRTTRNENSRLRFQVLHLRSNPALILQNGPALSTRLAMSNTKDHEFCEHNGLLMVSRFFKNITGNEAVRYCLEDSIRVQPLKHNKPPEALRLTIGKPGLLDSLAFIHDERFDIPLGEMEVEVDVKATGVK